MKLPENKIAYILLVLIFFISFLYSCKDASYTQPAPISGISEETFDKLLIGLGRDKRSTKGKKLFINHCAHCHTSATAMKTPGFVTLGATNANAIFISLETGKMSIQGAALSKEEKIDLAEWLTGTKMNTDVSMPESVFCQADTPVLPVDVQPDWSGWGKNLASTGFQSLASGGIPKDKIGDLELKWAFALPNVSAMRTGLSIIGNQVIIGGQNGMVTSIDLHTACIHWSTKVSSGIRGSVSVSQDNTGRWVAYAADFQTTVYALDIQSGDILWSQKIAEHANHAITGSLAVYNEKVYVPLTSMEVVMARSPMYECCTSSGQVVALDANNGTELWRHRVIDEAPQPIGKNKHGVTNYAPSGAPVWSSPTVDVKRNILYIGTGQNYTRPTTTTSDAIIAIDLETGKSVWHFQAIEGDAYSDACWAPDNANCPDPVGPDHDFGMAPILIERTDGKEVLVVGQKSGIVFCLDPDEEGKVLWSQRIGKGGLLGGLHWGITTDGVLAYATNADHPIALHSGDPDTDPKPGVYALDLMDGEIKWEARADETTCQGRKQCYHVNSAAPSGTDGLVFAGSLDGHIRAYDAENGEILWDYNTIGKQKTVNGVPGKGGSLDCAAPVIARGMLFVNSGYWTHGATQGNVLMAFGLKGN